MRSTIVEFVVNIQVITILLSATPATGGFLATSTSISSAEFVYLTTATTAIDHFISSRYLDR